MSPVDQIEGPVAEDRGSSPAERWYERDEDLNDLVEVAASAVRSFLPGVGKEKRTTYEAPIPVWGRVLFAFVLAATVALLFMVSGASVSAGTKVGPPPRVRPAPVAAAAASGGGGAGGGGAITAGGGGGGGAAGGGAPGGSGVGGAGSPPPPASAQNLRAPTGVELAAITASVPPPAGQQINRVQVSSSDPTWALIFTETSSGQPGAYMLVMSTGGVAWQAVESGYPQLSCWTPAPVTVRTDLGPVMASCG